MRTLTLSAVFALISIHGICQDRTGKTGLSANVQSLQLDINVPVWISDESVLSPSVGFLSASKTAVDFALGIAFRKYFSNAKLSPYGGVRVSGFFLVPKDGSASEDFLIGATLGSEYFLDDKISAGIEAQLNATFSDRYSNRFGNPNGTNVNTATALFVSFYFN